MTTVSLPYLAVQELFVGLLPDQEKKNLFEAAFKKNNVSIPNKDLFNPEIMNVLHHFPAKSLIDVAQMTMELVKKEKDSLVVTPENLLWYPVYIFLISPTECTFIPMQKTAFRFLFLFSIC